VKVGEAEDSQSSKKGDGRRRFGDQCFESSILGDGVSRLVLSSAVAFPHPLTSMCRCSSVSIDSLRVRNSDKTYLERILPREAFVAVIARERLDSKMDPLVPLQIVIPVEALGALIALERSVVGSGLLVLRVAHEMRHSCGVTAVESWHHRGMASNKCQSTVGVLNVGEDRCLTTGVLQWWPLLILVG